MTKFINLRTQEEHDKYLKKLEKEGYLWRSGEKPTSVNFWNIYKENFCICINEKEKVITHSFLEYCLKSNYKQIFMTKNWDNLEVGYEIKTEYGIKTILGICGRAIFLSADDEKDVFWGGYTKEDCIEKGWTIVGCEDTEEEEDRKAIERLKKRGKIKNGKILN